MALYITGDLHGELNIDKLKTERFPVETCLKKSDYLIIAGDFGLVWGGEKAKRDEKWIKWLADKPYTILVVDGNHENHELLNKLPVEERFGGKVGVIHEKHIYHLKRGEFYTIDGRGIFTFGGAISVDREYRVLGYSWWEEEVPSEEEMIRGKETLVEHASSIDYIITHTCPSSVMKLIDDVSPSPTVVNEYLEEIKELLIHAGNTKYKWYFGHWHLDRDINRWFRLIYNDIELMNR